MDYYKRKISEVLAARELYSLNCSLLAKQFFFYLCSCSQKHRSARMLANARKDHSSPLNLRSLVYRTTVKKHFLWRSFIYPPQALRFSHGFAFEASANLSEWWRRARDHGKSKEGRRGPFSPLPPSFCVPIFIKRETSGYEAVQGCWHLANKEIFKRGALQCIVKAVVSRLVAFSRF